MQLVHDRPDIRYELRGADGSAALVNERRLGRSFALSADTLLEDWPVADVAALRPADLDALLALEPEVVVLGTGGRLRFPAPALQAHCLARGIGLEAMANAAAARTFNVLAGEGRRVVAAFILDGA